MSQAAWVVHAPSVIASRKGSLWFLATEGSSQQAFEEVCGGRYAFRGRRIVCRETHEQITDVRDAPLSQEGDLLRGRREARPRYAGVRLSEMGWRAVLQAWGLDRRQCWRDL